MKIIKEFILREIAGEYVLIPTGDTTREFNGLITLTDTARFIWEHLESTNSFNELLDLILEEYEIDRDTAAQDAAQLIVQLLNRRFVALTKEDGSW